MNSMFIFEYLPNELIIEIFKYLKTEDIFQIFYNLNFRLNLLIQSLIHLNYSSENINNHILSYPYIRSLIINTTINNKLNLFPNVRHLVLNYVTDDFLSELNQYNLPNLESILVNHNVHPFYMFNLQEKIFSNQFSNLKYCYISRIKFLNRFEFYSQTYSLRYLKLNDINSFIYLSILNSCPNLYFFKFKLSIKSKIQSNIILHKNLKKLIINMNFDYYPWNDDILNEYFLCIPNIEQLKISRSISYDKNLINYLKYYNWLFSIISKHFFKLQKFQFNLYFNRSFNLFELNFQNISYDLKTSFYNIYQGRYQSQLFIF